MNTTLIILAVVCAIVGIIGSIVPGLPGPPVSWVALLLLHLSHKVAYSTEFLVIFAVVAAVITVLDYIIPVLGTKKFGGTKAGARGSTWGLIVGVIVLPLLGITLGPMGIIGILAGPFVGAYIGEQRGGNSENALRSAFGSFVGFLAGTLMKLAYCIVVMVYVCKGLF